MTSIPDAPAGNNADGTVSGGDWAASLSPEFKPLVEAKGWKSQQDVLRSYSHLEKRLGADRVPVPGKDATPEEWAHVWDRLGRPQAPDLYQFAKAEDLGDLYDDNFANWFRGTAHKAGLSASQAAALHDAYIDYARGFLQSEAGAGGMMDAEPELRREWGHEYDRKYNASLRAARSFAQSDAEVQALEKAVGSANALRLLARIGEAMTEDSVVGDGKSHLPSVEEAKKELEAMRKAAYSDPRHPLMDKTHRDYKQQLARMRALNALVAQYDKR